jgi:hypothetical protein
LTLPRVDELDDIPDYPMSVAVEPCAEQESWQSRQVWARVLHRQISDYVHLTHREVLYAEDAALLEDTEGWIFWRADDLIPIGTFDFICDLFGCDPDRARQAIVQLTPVDLLRFRIGTHGT